MAQEKVVFTDTIICEDKAQRNGRGSAKFSIGKVETVTPEPGKPAVRVAKSIIDMGFVEPEKVDVFKYGKKYEITITEVE